MRDWRRYVLHLLGLATLFFLAGNTVVEFRLFPYRHVLRPAFAEWRTYMARRSASGSPEQTNLWFAASGKPVGATVDRPAERSDGYTLFTTPHPNGAVLINPAGEVVHVWHKRFREVWPMASRIRSPEPVENTHWRKAHLYPNGDILTVYASLGYEPYGHGFARLDKKARVIWKAPVLAHHDFDVGDEGEIYTLAHRYRDTEKRPVSGAAFYPKRVQEDFIVELSPSGEVRRRVSVLDAFANSPFRGVLRPTKPDWDVLHMNTVEIVSEEFAAHHPFAEAGQLLISSRSLDLIGLLDMDKGRMVWVSQGFWRRQHSPVPMANGRILLFDNEGRFNPEGKERSQVVEFDPQTNAVNWSYGAHERQPLYSRIRGWLQPLPNGNVLITESQRGRLVEVTRDGSVAWAFRHPLTRRLEQANGEQTRFRPIVMGGVRIPESYIEFELNWRKRVDAAAPTDASPEERARISWSLFRKEGSH